MFKGFLFFRFNFSTWTTNNSIGSPVCWSTCVQTSYPKVAVIWMSVMTVQAVTRKTIMVGTNIVYLFRVVIRMTYCPSMLALILFFKLFLTFLGLISQAWNFHLVSLLFHLSLLTQFFGLLYKMCQGVKVFMLEINWWPVICTRTSYVGSHSPLQKFAI